MSKRIIEIGSPEHMATLTDEALNKISADPNYPTTLRYAADCELGIRTARWAVATGKIDLQA